MGQTISDECERVPAAVEEFDQFVWNSNEPNSSNHVTEVLEKHRLYDLCSISDVHGELKKREQEQLRKSQAFRSNHCEDLDLFHYRLHLRYSAVCASLNLLLNNFPLR